MWTLWTLRLQIPFLKGNCTEGWQCQVISREDGGGQLSGSPQGLGGHEGWWLFILNSLGHGCQDVWRSPSPDDLSLWRSTAWRFRGHNQGRSLFWISSTSFFLQKMFQADPDFAMGHIMTLGLQCLGTTPSPESPIRKKLSQFNDEPKANLTSHELLHLTAANQMAVEVNMSKNCRHFTLILGHRGCHAHFWDNLGEASSGSVCFAHGLLPCPHNRCGSLNLICQTFWRSHLQHARHAKVSCEALQALNPFLRERSRKT